MELDLTKPQTTEKNKVQEVRLIPSKEEKKIAKVVFSGPAGTKLLTTDITDILSDLTDAQLKTYNSVLKKIVAKAGNKKVTDIKADFYEKPVKESKK